MGAAPFLLYRSVLPFVRGLMGAGERFDAIDAHYMYPDGVAAVWLGRRLGLPTVVTARGTDVNLIPQYRLPRQLIRRAIDGSAALIAVSAALKAAMVELGAPDGKVTVLRNGVDTALFHPTERDATRHALGLTRTTLISVGLLIERKGHHRVIEALTRLPDFDLLVVGEGSEHGRLQALAARLGLAEESPIARGTSACRASGICTVQRMHWFSPRSGKAGPMCCWRRWRVERRSLPATSGVILKSFSAPKPACWHQRIRRTVLRQPSEVYLHGCLRVVTLDNTRRDLVGTQRPRDRLRCSGRCPAGDAGAAACRHAD